MSVEIQVPRLAESLTDATLAEWLKPDGAAVREDEPIATLETDKAAMEIAATASGVLRHARKPGERVVVGDVLARIEGGPAEKAGAPATSASEPPAAATPVAPAAVGAAAAFGPAVRRLVEEHHLDPGAIVGSGKGGRLLKEDVLKHLERAAEAPAPATPSPAPPSAAAAVTTPSVPPAAGGFVERERVVPMSRIRQRIAERLVQAQHTAAILTTFNEIDMGALLELRARWKDGFEKKHGVKLGFMSFFTRAAVLALADVPGVNAEIRGTDLVYREHVHVGIAVGTPRGLVVPIVRFADQLTLAQIEREIARLAERGRLGQLTPDEMSGGTFTISNGGVYGSLLSTPILNPPQSGILGMHKIEKRPVVANDQVVIRPMMYVALSYDHRVVDGEQAVTFLVRVKERLEDPERMMLEV